MQKLQTDLKNPTADLDVVAKEYKKAIDDYQDGVVGNDA